MTKFIFFISLLFLSFSLHAVHLSKNGTGQVLIFPYYTINGGYDTLINIENTTNETKALRVRFREAANSREVFAFNVYLGAFDVWTGGLINSEDGIPQILSFDQSCSIPDLSYNSNVKFHNEKYTGEFEDSDSDSLFRMREGFIEVFEMGVVTGDSADAVLIEDNMVSDCAMIENAWNAEGYWAENTETDMLPPTGGISGNVTLINVSMGMAISQEPTAFQNFSESILNFNIDNDSPSLADSNTIAQIENNGELTELQWPTGYQAISSLLMKQSISNEFVLTDFIGADTDWIVTMPTRQYHTDPMFSDGPIPVEPFAFDEDNNSCEEYGYAYWNRENQAPIAEVDSQLPGILPPIPPIVTPVLCHSANNIAFYDGEFDNSLVPFGIFSSYLPDANNEQKGVRIETLASNEPIHFDTGWMNLYFGQSSSVMGNNNQEVTLVGMPVIGFAAQTYINSSDILQNKNYAGIFAHKYSKVVINDETAVEEKAMQISQDNKGQVLLFPYYTVKNGINTLISIANTTNEAKTLRIRFLEGNNSRNVLSFNIYLPAYDVWTAGLIPTESTTPGFIGESTVKLLTFDNSCTIPAIINGQEFLPYGFTGELNDGFGESLSRSQEGSIEIFEMGTLNSAIDISSVTHSPSGVPSCERINTNWMPPSGKWFQDPNDDISPATGSILASVSLIDVDDGIDMTYDATAIVNFSSESNHTDVGNDSPNLSTGNNTKTLITTDEGLVKTTWESPINAVTALFMQSEVSNDYVVDPAINAQTDWVNFYPTKRFYTDPLFMDSNIGPEPFISINNRCETFQFQSYNRDQQINGDGPQPLPTLPPGLYSPQHCWGVNTVSINEFGISQTLFGSDLPMGDWLNIIDGFDTVYSIRETSGWMKNIFNETSSLTGTGDNGETHTIFGLPVLGFTAEKYINNNSLPGVLANYAVIKKNSGKRKITIQAPQ